MVQRTSPFIEANYGWNVGESGWAPGMDENLLKFSYMLDNGVDGVVSSLPQTPVNGSSYYLTSDNRFYFVVDGTYYSAPCPKWFTFKLKASGQKRIYDGSSVVNLYSEKDVNQLVADSSGLRSELYSGRDVVGYKFPSMSSVQTTSSRKMSDIVSVRDFGAKGDGVTDDSLAFSNALNISKNVLLPDASSVFYIKDSNVHRLIEKSTMYGPGKLKGDYFESVKPFGKNFRSGICTTEVGNDLAGGFVIGGEDSSQPEGIRLWAQHPSWGIVQPTVDGFPLQLQLYSNSKLGTATSSSGNTLNAVYSNFILNPVWSKGLNLVSVGDEIGFGDELYLISSIDSSSQIKVTSLSGGLANITDSSEKVFRHAYEYSYGICEVSGNKLIWKSGIQFNVGTSVPNQSKIYLDGVLYPVLSVDSPTSITLNQTLPNNTNVYFIQKDLDPARYTSLLRIQSLKGSKEENFSLSIDTKGRALLDLTTAGGLAAPGFTVRSDSSYDGSNVEEHFHISRDGRFGFGAQPQTGVRSYSFSTNTIASNSVGNGGGNSRSILHRYSSTFAGNDQRFADIGISNNYMGIYLQSYSSNLSTPTQTQLNPLGGSVAIGTWADVASSGITLAVKGVTAPFGDNQYSSGTSSNRWNDSYSVRFRPGSGSPIWTSGNGSPEGVLVAPVGSLYTRTDGGTNSTLYIKESGSGNTGWVAK